MKLFRMALVLAIAWVVAGHAPGAWACSCVEFEGDRRSYALEQAELAWVGTAVASDPADPPSDDHEPIDWTFEVERVLKGDVADPQIVSSGGATDTCGYRFTIGHRYRVHAGVDDEGNAHTGLCSWNEDLGEAPVEPTPTISGVALGEQGDTGGGSSAMVIALGAIAVATIGGALFFVRARPGA